MPSTDQNTLPLDFSPAGTPSAQLTAWTPAAWPLAAGWAPVVTDFLGSATGRRLGQFISARLAAEAVIYPPAPFRALALLPLDSVRAVILGQDPYHGPGQAEGLAFSVAPGVKSPPSLRNIFKELQRERLLGPTLPASGSLSAWAAQGVLLLNSSLTVEDGLPASHAKQGWEALTDAILAKVAATAPHCAYLLWGTHAQAKAPLIQQVATAHERDALILQSNHPSPLSALRPPAPFIGCGHFAEASAWLAARGSAIDWSLPAT